MPDVLHPIDAREVLRRHGLEFNAYDRPKGAETAEALLKLEARLLAARETIAGPTPGGVLDGGVMKLVSVKHTFEQDEDCCGRPDALHQLLDVKTFDGGGGSYLVLTTERWAISDVDEFAARLKGVLAPASAPALIPEPCPGCLGTASVRPGRHHAEGCPWRDGRVRPLGEEKADG